MLCHYNSYFKNWLNESNCFWFCWYIKRRTRYEGSLKSNSFILFLSQKPRWLWKLYPFHKLQYWWGPPLLSLSNNGPREVFCFRSELRLFSKTNYLRSHGVFELQWIRLWYVGYSHITFATPARLWPVGIWSEL